MDELVVTGVSASALTRGVQSGRFKKVCAGLYLTREPTPRELLYLLLERYPGLRIAGLSAAQLYLKQELTLPLHIAHRSSLPHSSYFQAVRTKRLASLLVDGIKVLIPSLAAETLDDSTALQLLETVYAKRTGPHYLTRHNKGIRLSPRVRELIEQAAIGTDSEAEKKLSRALQKAGLTVHHNVLLGAYYWDLVIPELNVIVEVDGYGFHNSDNRLTFAKDRWKGNDAVLAGYILLRYSGSCITYELDRVVEQILSARLVPQAMPEHGVWTWHWLFVRNPDRDHEFLYSS